MKFFILLLAMLLLGCTQVNVPQQNVPRGENMRKVLLVVPPSEFRDEELFSTMQVINSAGFKTVIASTRMGQATGMLGGKVTPDILVSEVNVEDYGAVVFIGGQGVETNNLPENPDVVKLAKDANNSGKIIGAICIAPRILARAGVVKGKRVTAFGDNTTISYLKRAGAVYTGNPLEKDGMLITADGPSSAVKFGEEIVRALGG